MVPDGQLCVVMGGVPKAQGSHLWGEGNPRGCPQHPITCSAPQAQEKQRLAEQLSVLNAAHAEEVQRLRAEMQGLREDAARDAQVQQLQERLAELERHSAESRLAQEVDELRKVCYGDSWGCS